MNAAIYHFVLDTVAYQAAGYCVVEVDETRELEIGTVGHNDAVEGTCLVKLATGSGHVFRIRTWAVDTCGEAVVEVVEELVGNDINISTSVLIEQVVVGVDHLYVFAIFYDTVTVGEFFQAGELADIFGGSLEQEDVVGEHDDGVETVKAIGGRSVSHVGILFAFESDEDAVEDELIVFKVTDSDGNLIAGCNLIMNCWRAADLDILWVEEKYRSPYRR